VAKFIVIDETRCLACGQCMIECAMAHTEAATLIEALSADATVQPRIHIEPCGEFVIPVQCRHCEDAPCIEVCPKDAIQRPVPNGPVLLDSEECVGCKLCVAACPFGAIYLPRGDSKIVVKCDLCIARTEAGEEPACVAGCPTGALQFRELDDDDKQKRRRTDETIRLAHSVTEGED